MESDRMTRFGPPWRPGRNSQVVVWVRVAVGCWLLVLTAILYAYHRAGWWTPLLVLAAAAHFYVAYRQQRLTHTAKPRH
jgi:hypothetical protein